MNLSWPSVIPPHARRSFLNASMASAFCWYALGRAFVRIDQIVQTEQPVFSR